MLPPNASDDEEGFEARVRLEVQRRMASTPAMLHSIDAKGRLISVSDNWLARLGYTREEVLGRPSSDFMTAASREHAIKNILPEFFRTGRCDNVEYQILRKDGGVIDVLISAVLHRDSSDRGGDTSIAVVTDISAMKAAERQLAESEARYRMFADNSTDIIALLDRDGGRRYVSPSCFAMTGYTPEEMQASRTADTTHPDDVARVLEELANMTGECIVTYRMRCKSGRFIWVETTCKPLTAEGQTDLRMCIVRNVDARMRAEQLLQESENRYRLLAENATDLIVIVAQDGTRSYVSPACEALLGYAPEEMLLINSLDTVHPDDVQIVHDMLASGPERPHQQQSFRYRIRRKDGTYIWVATTARAVDIAGKEDQRLLMIRDVGQRMQAEQKLTESEARYRLLADNSTDMVFRLDTDLVRRYISPACREILGYEPEEMLAIKPIDMVHPEDVPRLALIFQTLLSGKADRHSIINRIRHQNGRWIWVEAQLRTLRDPDDGTVTGIIGALRDISVRKAIEDELAEANRRLRALAGQDSLTGLANRRAFDEALAKEHLRSRRDKTQLGLIMIDVDHFKRFNDLYGHLGGDDCLRCVGAAIGAALLRPGDLAARYGGEEFAVLLPDTDEAGAAVTAERIREAIFGLNIRHEGNSNQVVTISSGVASLSCLDIEADRLIATADQALYRAKDNGRNAVCRSSEMTTATGAAANVA